MDHLRPYGHAQMQHRLDANPDAIRIRCQTVGHLFGILKSRMALHVLAYNLTRALNVMRPAIC